MEKKMEFNTAKLLKLELLRKIPKSKEKSKESIRTAESWLKEAENNFRGNTFRSCILSSYNAMFHSARAILFKDGFREKSHFAVARYLEDNYVKKNLLEDKWVKLLDHYRETRHNDQYSTSFIATKEEAEQVLRTAKGFVEMMESLLD